MGSINGQINFVFKCLTFLGRTHPLNFFLGEEAFTLSALMPLASLARSSDPGYFTRNHNIILSPVVNVQFCDTACKSSDTIYWLNGGLMRYNLKLCSSYAR